MLLELLGRSSTDKDVFGWGGEETRAEGSGPSEEGRGGEESGKEGKWVPRRVEWRGARGGDKGGKGRVDLFLRCLTQ